MAVIELAAVREQRRVEAKARDEAAKPEWADDIITLALYAQMVKAEQRAEQARYLFEAKRDGLTDAWWNWPEGMKERVHENNRQWRHYQAMLTHLASLPAASRSEARVKRSTIGNMWLKPGNDGDKMFERFRQGCLADDHLFPPSLKLARLKGDVRVS